MTDPIGPVDVHVKSMPQPSYRRQYSTIKTWIIDAAGVAGPVSIQTHGNDDKERCEVFIYSMDANIIVSTDDMQAPIVSAAGGAIPGAAIPVSQGASNGVKLYGNIRIWLNAITAQAATRVVVITTRYYAE